MKLDILAFGSHPDDTELGCSGTLMKHINNGYKVGVVDLTLGQLGSRGDVPTRFSEANAAKEIQGLVLRENLEMEDGWFQSGPEEIRKVVQVIRKYQPSIVLANAISDRHPDHGKGSRLVSEACFYSGLSKIETQNEGISQNAWRPQAVYHYIQDYHIEPDFVVDVTEVWEKKIDAIMAFKSQFYNPASNEPQTPISSKSFLNFLESRARVFGRPIGVDFAEGFTKERYLGVHSLFDLF